MMRFTVVTVCYNAGNKLRETVKNILEQKGIAFELLIKDGASKDDSLMKCEEFLVSNGYRKNSIRRVVDQRRIQNRRSVDIL